MRAAACLAQRYPQQAEKDLIGWVENPKTKGLAFLLAGQLHTLPDDVAKNIATAGLKGPHKRDFRVRLVRLQDPRISPILERIKE